MSTWRPASQPPKKPGAYRIWDGSSDAQKLPTNKGGSAWSWSYWSGKQWGLTSGDENTNNSQKSNDMYSDKAEWLDKGASDNSRLLLV